MTASGELCRECGRHVVRHKVNCSRRSPGEPVETPDYAAMMRRMVKAYGRRVGQGDPVDLGDMVTVRRLFDDVLVEAARAQHAEGFTWREIAAGLGTSRQAAFQRFSIDRSVNA